MAKSNACIKSNTRLILYNERDFYLSTTVPPKPALWRYFNCTKRCAMKS